MINRKEIKTVLVSLLLISSFLIIFLPMTEAEETLTLYFNELQDYEGYMSTTELTGGDLSVDMDSAYSQSEGVLWVYEVNDNIAIKGTITVDLYFTSSLIVSREINVSLWDLYNLEQLGSTQIKKITITRSSKKVSFDFSNINHELIPSDAIGVFVTTTPRELFGKPVPGLIKFSLQYNSKNNPSCVKIPCTITEISPIRLGFVTHPGSIKPGGTATYEIKVYNDGEENDTVTISCKSSAGWDAEFTETQTIETALFVHSDSYNSTPLNVTAPSIESNGTIEITATGATGSAVATMNVTSSAELYDYAVEIIKPPGHDARPGQNISYSFRIKNIGEAEDTYNFSVSSQNHWDAEISETEVTIGIDDSDNKCDIEVTLFIPEDAEEGTKDTLYFSITSHYGATAETSIVTTIIGPGISELIYQFFTSAAQALNLDQVAGDWAPYLLILIIAIIIVFIFIILIVLIRRKYVNIICLDRIREITAGKKVTFKVTVENPYKMKLSYKLSTKQPSLDWNVKLDKDELFLGPKQSENVAVTVESSKEAKPEDWAEIKLTVAPTQKPKPGALSLIVSIKESKAELFITDVKHKPKSFVKGDRITTSFKIENRGDLPAHTTVVLYVNSQELNRVDDLFIPERGYDVVELPWIAFFGKNNLHITVR